MAHGLEKIVRDVSPHFFSKYITNQQLNQGKGITVWSKVQLMYGIDGH